MVIPYMAATTGNRSGFMAVLLGGCSSLILQLNDEGILWCVDKYLWAYRAKWLRVVEYL